MHAFLQIVASNSLVVTVLAVCVALLGRIWKNPVGLHLLWVFVLLKLVTPPLVTVPLALPANERPVTSGQHGTNRDVAHQPPAGLLRQGTASATANGLYERGLGNQVTAGSPAVVIDNTPSVTKHHAIPWLTILVWTWGAGIALCASRHAYRIVRFRRLIRAAEAPPSALLSMAEEISKRLGLTRVPQIVLLRVRLSPLVWSIGERPRVLLPAALLERLDADAQQAILAHELAHVWRKDHWVRLLELVVATLFWWHPVVWWACRQLRELEEQCCDGLVLGAVSHGPKAYATALLDTLDFLSERPVTVPLIATGANSPVSLKRRIKMLKNRAPVTRLTVGRLVLLVAVAAVPMAVAFAARPPQKEDGLRSDDRESSHELADRNSGRDQAKGSPAPQAAKKSQADQPPAAKPEADAKTVRGEVIDESGKPVAGAEIWLPVFTRERHVLDAKADSQGRFALEVPSAWLAELQPWNRAMAVWAYATGRQLGTGKAVLPSGASEVMIRLGPATDTSFVVLDPEGRPCAGALVEPYYIRTWQGYQFLPDELLARVGARTNTEGQVKLPAAPPDLLYQVRVTTKDFGIQLQRTIEAPTIVGRAIRLRPTGKIEGRVIADQPEIVRGVRLIFTSQENRDRPRPWPTEEWPTEGFADVKSDEQGRFIVPAIAVGDGRIDAVVDEKLPLRPRLPGSMRVQANQTSSLDIPMVSTVVVRGSVRVQDTGKPVPGALVHIYYGVGRQGADPVSDAQGKYTARVLPGRIQLQVISMPEPYVWLHGDAPPFPPYEVPENAKEFDLPPVEVAPAKSIAGRVVDERGQPVGNIRISVLDGTRRYGHGKSDKDGQFNVVGMPVTVDPTKVKYEWHPEVGSTMPSACEILKTNPLILRALPRDPRMDLP